MKNILIYSGHNALIGGDAHYIFSLINSLDISNYNLKLFTDINPLFKERSYAWLKVDIPINYLPTRPHVFKKFSFEKHCTSLDQNNVGGFSIIIHWILTFKIANYPICKYFDWLYKKLSFARTFDVIKNFFIFYKLFKEQKSWVDVFHFNNGGYPAKEAGLIAIIVAKLFKVKVIIMKYNNVPRKKNRLRPIEYVYDYLIPKYCTYIISDSDMTRLLLIKRRKFPFSKIITIRDGMENVKLMSKEEIEDYKFNLGIRKDSPVLLISGNLQEDRKGHIQLFNAIKIVCSKYPETLLLVVGNADRKREMTLKEIVRDLGLNKNILFLGYRKDIYELNSISDITLTPSVGVESIPFTILEGARVAKPVITTTAGACSEGVIDGQTGFIVQPFKIDQLVEKIIFLLDNKDLRKEMGLKSKILFLERFLLQRGVNKHLELFNS